MPKFLQNLAQSGHTVQQHCQEYIHLKNLWSNLTGNQQLLLLLWKTDHPKCCIVTRFGEISPLRLIFSVFRDNCKKISIWQKVFIFWPNLCCWAIFICFKWPNIEQKIYPSGHIICLSKQTDSSEMQFSTQNFGILDVYLFEENYFFFTF